MSTQIAVQLYSIREQLANDYAGTIDRITSFGYAGVEFAGAPSGLSYQQCLKVVKDSGLKVSSAHMPIPSGANRNFIFDNTNLLGCKYIVCGKWIPDFATIDAIKKSCDDFNCAAAEAAKHGLKLAIHNHWAEFELVDGIPAYKYLLEYLDPAVMFEIDTYWVKIGGQDPAAVLAELGERAPLVHIKDGSGEPGNFKMLPVGQGVMDFSPIFKQCANEWLICELDEYEGDMLEAVKASYDYISKNKCESLA